MTPIKLEAPLNEYEYTHLAIQMLADDSIFPWYYNASTAYRDNEGAESLYQFVHVAYKDGNMNTNHYYFSIVMRIIEKAEQLLDKQLEIYRAKLNLLPRQPHNEEDLEKAVHTDIDEEGYVSIIYYLEDSDGDTVLYKDEKEELERFTPVANTGIIFDSNTRHRATPPTKNKVRRVINIIAKVL